MHYATVLFTTCLLSLGFATAAVAQPYVAGEVYHDAARAIEYHAGDAPFVLSVPHGGALAPDSLPDRDCEGCSYLRDSYTQELAREFILAYRARTGCSPHVVINLLHRRKLDMNRDLAEATDSLAAKEPCGAPTTPSWTARKRPYCAVTAAGCSSIFTATAMRNSASNWDICSQRPVCVKATACSTPPPITLTAPSERWRGTTISD